MPTNAIVQSAAQSGSFRSQAATHPGKRRYNEDAYLNRPDLGLWAVADGAGGHQSGEIASTEVVTLLGGIEAGLSAAQALNEVRTRLEAAHLHLQAEAARRGEDVIMATTVVVVLVRDGHFACLWVGDSPCYLLRGRAIMKITREHSLVQEMVDRGVISASEAEHHPQANVITRAVGADSDTVELEKRTGRLLPGDRLLLCSDGLSKTLPAERLAELLADAAPAPAERLVNAALEAHVSDNVTVIAIEFDGVLEPANAGEHDSAAQAGDPATEDDDTVQAPVSGQSPVSGATTAAASQTASAATTDAEVHRETDPALEMASAGTADDKQRQETAAAAEAPAAKQPGETKEAAETKRPTEPVGSSADEDRGTAHGDGAAVRA